MLVPIEQMVDSININKKETEIPVGGWVRIERGTYAGDLGKVIEVSDAQDSALIKVVPRLNLEGHDNDMDRKRKKGERPPPRHFHPDRLSQRQKYALMKKGPYWQLGNDSFRDGYLEKSFKTSALQIENVSPSLEEITNFMGDADATGEDAERALDISAASLQAMNDAQASSLLQTGDIVEITEGGMKNCVGTIENVDESSVTVVLDLSGMKRRVTVPSRQVRKNFKPGDHVKAIHGRHKDESGMVVKVEDSVITMLADSSMAEIKVFAKDLREAAEVTSSRTSMGIYDLHDLVQLE